MTTCILQGNVFDRLSSIPDCSVDCVVTSPPYWGLRSYLENEDCLGMERYYQKHVSNMVTVLSLVYRILKDDGIVWFNYGDAYQSGNRGKSESDSEYMRASAGTISRANKGSVGVRNAPHRMTQQHIKPKDLMLMGSRIALAAQQPILQCNECHHPAHKMYWGVWPDMGQGEQFICPKCFHKDCEPKIYQKGWWVRSEIIWSKKGGGVESVRDRPTRAHEKVFMFTKSEKYFYNYDAVKQEAKDGNGYANLRNVWHLPTGRSQGNHFATMPESLVKICIKASTDPENGRRVVLDPFGGSGTTAKVADELGCHSILIELEEEYCKLAKMRLEKLGQTVTIG